MQYKKPDKLRKRIGDIDNQLCLLDASPTSSPSTPVEVDGGGRRLRYILDGRAGVVNYPGDDTCLFTSEIVNGLEPLPESHGDNYLNNIIRESKPYQLQNFGACQFYTPNGTEWAASSHQVRKEESHYMNKGLQKLFKGERTKFQERAMLISTVFNTQAYGAGDAAIEGIILGWTGAIFEELGITGIDSSSLAKGCPSRKTLARNEARLATDCMLVVLQEIMDDGAKHFAILTDHGKRGELDHFVKILVWIGWEDETKTKNVVKFHCLDVDTSSHDAAGCAEAVKKSLELFSGLTDFTSHCNYGGCRWWCRCSAFATCFGGDWCCS